MKRNLIHNKSGRFREDEGQKISLIKKGGRERDGEKGLRAGVSPIPSPDNENFMFRTSIRSEGDEMVINDNENSLKKETKQKLDLPAGLSERRRTSSATKLSVKSAAQISAATASRFNSRL